VLSLSLEVEECKPLALGAQLADTRQFMGGHTKEAHGRADTRQHMGVHGHASGSHAHAAPNPSPAGLDRYPKPWTLNPKPNPTRQQIPSATVLAHQYAFRILVS
jgi:hypothetical protein